ncbi:uncharacterized protein LOC123717353 [Pieris brassicae]|uniref:uncharacterized protein LOC123717353 n=1 Tax=Pieris brassicae TaxID=7116 RepID=UPI001E6626A5|nr:uncharacterized protein LOC123717353 [Pieris brassicae]
MMDIKDIIKWFIPCYHLLLRFARMDVRLTFVCLFLFFSCPSYAGKVNSAKDVGFSDKHSKQLNISSDYYNYSQSNVPLSEERSSFEGDTSMGRTFGRPFKKMIQAFIPLAFQMGAASTWAVVAALVGVKTLAITLLILKVLLIAGAAKIGALFGAAKGHHGGWEQPHQKEIHLHIHGQHGEEHIPISQWNREGQSSDPKHVNVVYEPYGGPQTISTPYGHYMKIEPGSQQQ